MIRYVKKHLAQLGEKNSNWKSETTCAQTGRTRAQRIYKHPIPCEICANPITERHHKDMNTLNNSSSNIQWLCRKHHMEIDGRMAKWKSDDRPRNTIRDNLGRFLGYTSL